MKYDTCPACGGSGKQKAHDAANDPNTTLPICLTCGGEGRIEVSPTNSDYEQ